MAFASVTTDRTAHAPTDGNHDQGTVFGFFFTLAKTFTAFGWSFQGQSRRTDAASHTDPGRGRGPHRGAPRAPADR